MINKNPQTISNQKKKKQKNDTHIGNKDFSMQRPLNSKTFQERGTQTIGIVISTIIIVNTSAVITAASHSTSVVTTTTSASRRPNPLKKSKRKRKQPRIRGLRIK